MGMKQRRRGKQSNCLQLFFISTGVTVNTCLSTPHHCGFFAGLFRSGCLRLLPVLYLLPLFNQLEYPETPLHPLFGPTIPPSVFPLSFVFPTFSFPWVKKLLDVETRASDKKRGNTAQIRGSGSKGATRQRVGASVLCVFCSAEQVVPCWGVAFARGKFLIYDGTPKAHLSLLFFPPWAGFLSCFLLPPGFSSSLVFKRDWGQTCA